MARLTKNIDTRHHGSLKAGRLLNGVLPPEKIAELIASGHAEATEHDDVSVTVVKSAENASGEGISLYDAAFSAGYAYAINDAVDSGLISKEEAATCGLMVSFEDDEAVTDDSTADDAGGDSEPSAVVQESEAPSPAKQKKGSSKK
ncbi:hypothetical protein AAA63_004312 [Salmonella enterica subsp. enterica]|nr:hypothetical protein [Salmonella enterica subsp. enterica serovar Poona]